MSCCGALPLESNDSLLRIQLWGTAGHKRGRRGPQKREETSLLAPVLLCGYWALLHSTHCYYYCSAASEPGACDKEQVSQVLLPWLTMGPKLGARQPWEPCTTLFRRAEVVSGGWCPLATGGSKSKSSLEEVFPYRGRQDSCRLRSHT